MRDMLLVGAGSFFGGMARFGLSSLIAQQVDLKFPLGTLAVNLIGSLFIGALAGLLPDSAVRLFIITGFLGGFTTFSAFSYESFLLFQADLWQMAVLYAVLSLIGCLLAVCLGYKASQIFV